MFELERKFYRNSESQLLENVRILRNFHALNIQELLIVAEKGADDLVDSNILNHLKSEAEIRSVAKSYAINRLSVFTDLRVKAIINRHSNEMSNRLFVLEAFLPNNCAADIIDSLQYSFKSRWLPRYGARKAKLILYTQGIGTIIHVHRYRLWKLALVALGYFGLDKIFAVFRKP